MNREKTKISKHAKHRRLSKMKAFKKWVALATAVAMMSSASGLNAQDVAYTGGNGYNEYRSTPQLAPAIALGIIALVAIIAVCVQNSNNSSHEHIHD